MSRQAATRGGSVRNKDKDWRSRLVIPEDRDAPRSDDNPASFDSPRFFKSKDPSDEMVHVEFGASWVNYNYSGKVLGRDNHRFPPENREAAFEEIDEAEVERIAPTVLTRIGRKDARAMMCPKCESSMLAGWFDIHGDLVGFLMAGMSAPQGLWFSSYEIGSEGVEIEVVSRETSSADGWRCPECGVAVVVGMQQ